jgi:arginase family enzyme
VAFERLVICSVDGYHPFFDTTPDGVLTDVGDLKLPNTSLDHMRTKLKPKVIALLNNYHMTWLGGDHSITLPAPAMFLSGSSQATNRCPAL